jgi:hypothetical protein
MIQVLTLLAMTLGSQAGAAPHCEPAGPLVKLPGLQEASGVAVSRRVPGRLWTHNDSGQPEIFALDAGGAVTAKIRLSGAAVEDWEAIGVGPCPAGSCLYVADIGDNDAKRKRITIYRLPEPDGKSSTAAAAEAIHATYPDGPRNAEVLLVAPDGRLSIVTKGDTAPAAVYRFPPDLRAGSTVKLERVGQSRDAGRSAKDDRITDGAVSADGEWVVLRSNGSVVFYRAAELTAGTWRETRRVDLAKLGEPQGEGVAFGAGNTLYVAGEGGDKMQPGTFARLTCTPNRE